MSTRIGSGVSGSADPATGSIAAGTKDTTGAHVVVAAIKWETSGVTLDPTNPGSDSAGNKYKILLEIAHGTGGEPHEAIIYCLAPKNDAALAVTANFSSSLATFRRIQVDAFSSNSGLFVLDGVGKSGTGTVSPYSTAALITSGIGFVYAGVGDFNALGGIAAGGTPGFTLSSTTGDSFAEFLLTNSGQTVTPGATSSSGATRWVMIAGAFLEVAQPAPAFIPPWAKASNGLFLMGVMPTGISIPSAPVTSVTGTLGYTNNNDTLAGAGTSTVTGTLGYTNNNDTLAASGISGGGNTGTLAYTNNNDTLAAAGTSTVKGTLAATNANDTLAAAGTSTVKGSLAYTNNNDTLAASGKSTVIGTLATSNNNDTLSASGNSGVPPVVTDYWRWIASIQRRIGI